MRRTVSGVLAALALLLGVFSYPHGPAIARTLTDAPLSNVSAVDPSAVQELQWGLNATNVRPAWAVTKGAGVRVCSVDTGVNETESLKGSVVSGANFVNQRTPTDTSDGEGHGTFTSSVIVGHGVVQGIAPEAQIVAVKVLGDDGTGTYTTVDGGIIYAVTHGCSVINLSLGGSGADYDGMKDTITWACSHNVSFAIASGNAGTSHEGDNPASVSSRCALTVGATTSAGIVADFSNYNDVQNEVVAPGQNIIGDSTAGPVQGSGTSASAPFVAGELALLRSLGASAEEATLVVLATVHRPHTIQAQLGMYGRGAIDIGRAVKFWLELKHLG